MHLVLKMQMRCCEFVEHACVVGAFEHPGAECGMNLDGSTDHKMTGFVRFHEGSTFVSFVSLVSFVFPSPPSKLYAAV